MRHPVEAARDGARHHDIAIGSNANRRPGGGPGRAKPPFPHDFARAVELGQEQRVRTVGAFRPQIAPRRADHIGIALRIGRHRCGIGIGLDGGGLGGGRHRLAIVIGLEGCRRTGRLAGDLCLFGGNTVERAQRRHRLLRHRTGRIGEAEDLRRGRCGGGRLTGNRRLPGGERDRPALTGRDEQRGLGVDLVDRHPVGPVGRVERQAPFFGPAFGREVRHPLLLLHPLVVQLQTAIGIEARQRGNRGVERIRDRIQRRRLRPLRQIHRQRVARPRLGQRDLELLLPGHSRQRVRPACRHLRPLHRVRIGGRNSDARRAARRLSEREVQDPVGGVRQKALQIRQAFGEGRLQRRALRGVAGGRGRSFGEQTQAIERLIGRKAGLHVARQRRRARRGLVDDRRHRLDRGHLRRHR